MIYIGIDPGKSGAMAVIHGDHIKTIFFSVEEYSKALYNIRSMDEPKLCVIEKVHSMPKQGVASTFAFGENYGVIQGLLTAYNIPFEAVTPQVWKKHYGISADKEESKELARRLFPYAELRKSDRARIPHDGICEALLLANYGKEVICANAE